MLNLVLKGRNKSYHFRYVELQQYPASLLATMARSDNSTTEAVDHSASSGETVEGGVDSAQPGSSSVVIQLDDMPKSPLTVWAPAAEVAHSLYRYGHIAADTLALILKEAPDTTLAALRDPFASIAELLLHLNLPGPVVRWLPPLETIQLHDFLVLSFCFSCKDLQHDHQVKNSAEWAVSRVLSYRPLSRANADEAANSGAQATPGPQGSGPGSAHNSARATDWEHVDRAFNIHRNRVVTFALETDQCDLNAPMKVFIVTNATDIEEEYAQFCQERRYGDDGPNLSSESWCISLGYSAESLRFAELSPEGQLSQALSVYDLAADRLVGRSNRGYIRGVFERLTCGKLPLHETYASYAVGQDTSEEKWVRVPLWVVCW